MWEALRSLPNAVYRGCTCKVEGYSQCGVFDQSMQDWFIAHKPESDIIMTLVAIAIGAAIMVLAGMLVLYFP